jgi:hypothetical protein
MDGQNLAICLGPNLVWEEEKATVPSLNAYRTELTRTSTIVRQLLESCAVLFAES